MVSINTKNSMISIFIFLIFVVGVRTVFLFHTSNYSVSNNGLNVLKTELCEGFAPFVEPTPFNDLIANLPVDWGIIYQLKVDNAEPIGSNTYRLNSGEEFRAIYQAQFRGDQHGNEQFRMRYVSLLNERQVNAIENSSSDFYHDVTLELGETASFNLRLSPLTQGIYDFVLLGIPYSEEVPQFGPSSALFAQRLTIIAGNAQPTDDLQFTRGQETGLFSDGVPNPPLLLTLDESFLFWSYPDPYLSVGLNEEVSFNIKAGYAPYGNPMQPETNLSRFAIALFDNYEQINIEPDTPVIYVEVTNNTAYTEIPVTLEPSLGLGYHDLLAVRIDNPRILSCVLDYTPAGEVRFGPQVEVRRVAVMVE